MAMEEMISRAESSTNNEAKKGKYMADELGSQTLKGLEKEEKLEQQVFELEEKIKTVHHQMTQSNLDIEANYSRFRLLED